jgi:membrane protease YdiL (CAAX protease family)
MGALLLLIPGFPIRIAAQATAGIIGLVGGLSYAFLIRAIGGMVAWRHIMILSVTWALSFVFGITPLLYTSGSAPAMMALTFCSFAVFGALGGMVTARLLRSVHNGVIARDFMPSIGIWSFSFGFAAVASNVVGEGLKMFLPEWIAWFIAFEAMALMIGSAGGYAVVQFFRSGTHGNDAPAGITHRPSSGESNRLYFAVLVTLCLPFYLNDFSDIYVKDWRLWLSIDYIAVKLLPFLVVFSMIRTQKMKPSAFGLNRQSAGVFLAVCFIGALSGVVIEQVGYLLLNNLHVYPPLGQMPEIENPFWLWLDLTAGLLMVGICEELVFRGYLRTFIARYTERISIIVAASALAFGFIHWSAGLEKVMVTSAIGAVFMLLYIRTCSLPAIMLSHFAVNFIDYAKLFPKFIFGSL